jgi:phage terminase large subunit-like protein
MMPSNNTKRWTRSSSDEIAVANGCYFDLRAAEHVRDFFARFLRHSKGQWAGQPFELLPWQWERLIAPLFGWKRSDHTRRFRRAYIEIPKKNGKSSLCSGISLYMLLADGEAGAEVYNAAADREQAAIVFNEAVNMIEASPLMAKRVDLVRSTKRIVYPKSASFYKALSADVPTKEGINWHCLIFDELHAQRTRALWDVLAYGCAARQQPLGLAITTAGYDRHSVCWEQHQRARAVLSGDLRDDYTFFALLYTAEPDDDWTKEETWRKANPSYGVTVMADQMASDCSEAQSSPAKENAFRRYRLNQWTEQDVRWLPMDKWHACQLAASPAELEGTSCFAGLDLATTTDLAALSLVFPNAEGGYDVLPYFWVPAECARGRERRDKVPYTQWIRAGLITPTEGDVIDYDVIRRDVVELGKRFHIAALAKDRWNSQQIGTQLAGEGFEIVDFGQGYASMSAPTKEFEKLVLAGTFRHGGNPVLTWMARNVVVETDAAGNIKPSKRKSVEKIDGIVAAIMALGIATARPAVEQSVYEKRGILSL